MTPEEYASDAMYWRFGKAQFDEASFKAIEKVFAGTIRKAVRAAYEDAARIVQSHPWQDMDVCAAAIRERITERGGE